MNLLLVDDEVIAIQGVMNCVEWDALPIEQIYTANSYQQAVEVFASNAVDIVLCDIEMPHGSGLELIGWINEHHPQTVNIILSCHDEFHFARQAVQLECIDYVLKPPTTDTLMPVLRRAVEHVQTHTKTARYQKLGQQVVQDVAGETPEGHDPTERARRYIIDHISEEISVSKLAGMMFLSPDHLSRSFKRRYGKSIIDFIVEYRMDLAAQMLRDTGLPITDIEARVGLGNNYSYFVKLFRKTYGMSPKTYRAADRQ